jgi:hypothetical protein
MRQLGRSFCLQTYTGVLYRRPRSARTRCLTNW